MDSEGNVFSFEKALRNLIAMPFSLNERVCLLYLATAAFLAGILYWRRGKAERSVKGLLIFLLPRSVYANPSAWLDLRFMLVNSVVKFFCLAPIVLMTPWLSNAILGFMTLAAGPPARHLPVNSTVLLGYTLLVTLLFDFSLYLGHYLQHKVGWLWEFHKVHHSAQVLHPGTAYRMHPVDDMLNAALAVLLTSGVSGIFTFWAGRPIALPQFWQVNVVVFAFYALGYNLRHSHVWLCYGPTVSKLLMSPAQHQIHHSSDPRHFDRNMGYMLSVWDWLFATLHVPQASDEADLKFGLGDGEDHEFDTVWKLYTYPLVRVYRRCFPVNPTHGGAVEQA